MKLSIVIVNYNVKYFLEQCLISVGRAIKNIPAEVFVVDNASSDGSVEMLREKFGWVTLIANTDNGGFSKANNQAMRIATGEYVLLLNPDTVVAEDTFEKCIAFMDKHPDAGALGVHMVDGKGNFLPESKRGLPTPSVAFYKTFGLAAFFPKSKTFGKYHLGFLPEKETNEVDILSGAYMFMRKKALDEIGLLDETFFMYGEDVDLSYRVIKGGYKNYYFADTSIIHYKGESTKKGSLNYVKVFYNAMIIFAKKHFSGNQSGLYSLLINFAIVFRGLLTLVAGVFASSYLFVVDALLSFGGIALITNYWSGMIKYTEDYYPAVFLLGVVPVYILIWITTTYFSGGYDKPFRIANILRGIMLGTVAIAVVYAFLPNEWRFSRAIILLGAVWTALEMLLTRTLYHLIRNQSLAVESHEETHSMVVGNATEMKRAETILRALGNNSDIIENPSLADTKKQAAIYGINEIIFCADGLSYKEVIQQIINTGKRVDYKILNKGMDALIGSNSKNTAGDLYVAEKTYALFKPENLRTKRLQDVIASLLLIVLLPLSLILVKNMGKHIANIFAVLFGKKTWVGFTNAKNLKQFPHAKPSVLHPSVATTGIVFSEEDLSAIELNYARHYSAANDLSLLIRNYRKLGQ